MVEITICGRGGQGGVTLAKLIATTYFLKGKYVQAFGVYAAERSGAPLQAFTRVDDVEITNHNQVRAPDHLVVLDRTLIAPQVAGSLKPEGWIIVNTPGEPAALAQWFSGRRVATIDATAIAVAHGLGTRAVPIVNTTMVGAIGRVFGLEVSEILAGLAHLNFGDANVDSAVQAFEDVQMTTLDGDRAVVTPPAASNSIASLFDSGIGGMPKIKTGSWATRKPERRELQPPCNHGCPAGNDVRSFLEAAGHADYDDALAVLLDTSPLPGVCGRVCPAPCMESCHRGEHDESVNIREVERFVADHADLPAPTKPWRHTPIAVVGSGPAGLSGAYHLARLGYPVGLFEGRSELGGVLRYGIPEYRLPRAVLDREISFVLGHGVVPVTNRQVSRKSLWQLTHEYAAVFAATGLQDARTLDLGNADTDQVEQGIQFLERIRTGTVRLDRQRVIVIGGGNTAIDAARSALRVGASQVSILYRRQRDQMPAIHEEIEAALEENVALHELVAPVHVQVNDATVVLTCQRMELGEPDESGRARPIPRTGDEALFDMACDRIILALGQSTDLSILPEGSDIHEGAALIGVSGAPLFVGGDFASHEGTVAAAIGSGRSAAWHIHRTLTGEDLFTPAAPVASSDEIRMHLFGHRARQEGETVEPGQRQGLFTEVRRGFVDAGPDHPAVTEAQRCFSCGVCNSCDRCKDYCPEGILLRDGDGYRFDYSYCKGCGVCATACPRGVIYMTQL